MGGASRIGALITGHDFERICLASPRLAAVRGVENRNPLDVLCMAELACLEMNH